MGGIRAPIILKAGQTRFVGPDNGLIVPAAVQTGQPLEPYRIIPKRLPSWLKRSNTFHGRDIFAPTAALLASGTPETALATSIDNLKSMELPETQRCGNQLRGFFLSIDRFGNAITSIRGNQTDGYSSAELVLYDSSQPCTTLQIPIITSYDEVPPETPLLLTGSSGYLELALSMGSAANRFNLITGAMLDITLCQETDNDS